MSTEMIRGRQECHCGFERMVSAEQSLLETKVNEAVSQLFQKLYSSPEILNNLLKSTLKGKTITITEYMSSIHTIYEDLITSVGLKDSLQGQSEYVVTEMFDNSSLGDILFNEFR